VDIAINDPDYNVRQKAINNISDEVLLVDIAKNDSNENVRREAIGRISDEAVLADIVKNESSGYVRGEAIGRISDEAVLADIVKNESSDYVRGKAIEKIHTDSILIEILKESSDESIQEYAAEHIKDKSLLVGFDEVKDKIDAKEKHEKQVDYLTKKFESEKHQSPELYESLKVALVDYHYYDLNSLAQKMESNNCDLFALTAYCVQDILYAGYDEISKNNNKSVIDRNNMNINRLKDKLGSVPFDSISFTKFVKNLD
jgi:hypothetical protein